MSDQVKKTPNEPDFDQLNPDIIRLAQNNTLLKQPIILFLHGDLTWTEALEMMVVLMGKEYKAQRKVLMDSLKEIRPMPIPSVAIEQPKSKLCLAKDSTT